MMYLSARRSRLLGAALVLSLGLLVATPGHAAPTCKSPRVLIVLDKSSSMVTGSVGGKTKWEVAKSALSAVLASYQGGIDFGLMIFPDPNQCGPGTVKVPIGPNSAAAIQTALADPPPTGGNYTPMSQSLDAAAALPELHDAASSNNVLLITDGWQYCLPYDASTEYQPVTSVAALAALKITTYVVGFGDSVDVPVLNKMAEAAATKVSPTCNVTGTSLTATDNCYYQANDPQALLGALQKIAKLVTAEKCDGIDNDCNGKIDDALARSCSSKCGTGTETCTAGVWTGCTAPQPQPEVCDGVDNNCDGTVDEGCACKEGEKRPCGSAGGECVPGTQTCTAGSWSECQGDVKPTAEICDGKDNNCDGSVDEGLTRPCQTACGAGVETCALGAFKGCTAPKPTQEICDGVDNDCDGIVDGANAICPQAGTVCVNGTCQPAPARVEGGCDCRIAAGRSAGSLLLLVGLGLLLLARARRRG